MTGDFVRILFAESLQLGTGNAVEILRLDGFWDRRIVVPRPNRLGAERITILDLRGRASLVATTTTGAATVLARITGQVCFGAPATRPASSRTTGYRAPICRASTSRSILARPATSGTTAVGTIAAPLFARTLVALSEFRHGVSLVMYALLKYGRYSGSEDSSVTTAWTTVTVALQGYRAGCCGWCDVACRAG
jgi:hypothetical protein